MWWLLVACGGAPEPVVPADVATEEPAVAPVEAKPAEKVVHGDVDLTSLQWVKPEPQELMKTDDGMPIHTRIRRIEDCGPQLVSLEQHDENIRIAIWPDSPKAPMQGKDCARSGYPIELEGHIDDATFVYGPQLVVERRIEGLRHVHVFSGPGELLFKARLDGLKGAEPVRYAWHDTDVLIATGQIGTAFRRVMLSTVDGAVLLEETADPDDIARMEVAAAKAKEKQNKQTRP